MKYYTCHKMSALVFCHICEKEITGVMSHTHIIHCKKRYYRCDIAGCNELCRYDEKQEHEDKCHNEKECEKCNQWYWGELSDHKKECSFRIVDCIYCKDPMEWIYLINHENECGNQTVNCSQCDDIVLRKALVGHCRYVHEIVDKELVDEIVRGSYRKVN